MSVLHDLGWVDLTLLGILCLSVLVGLWRGLAFEVVSLLGWLVAYLLANAAGPFIAGLLPGGADVAPWRLWGCYAAVFVIVLIACTALARLLRALISATPLSVLDRLLGGVFGLLRAALVMVIIATLVALSPFQKSPAWQDSHGQVWLGQALELLKPVLPERLNIRFAA
jgi:membrane protein required for colicin V production